MEKKYSVGNRVCNKVTPVFFIASSENAKYINTGAMVLFGLISFLKRTENEGVYDRDVDFRIVRKVKFWILY